MTMALPTISGEARLTEDPNLRFSPSGVAIAEVSLAFNSRKFNKTTNEWEDSDSFFVRGTVFNDHAENVAASLVRADVVTVTGRLRTEKWQDKTTGEQRSKTALMIDSIGPSLGRATAKVSKTERSGGGGGSYGASQAQSATPAADPWATGSDDSQVPF